MMTPLVHDETCDVLSRAPKPAHFATQEILKVPAFETEQGFLLRTAMQLRIPDQSEKESEDRVQAFIDLQVLGSYEKSVTYGQPVSDQVKQRLNFMTRKQLSKIEFKLSLTPTGIAVRFLSWLHEHLGTDAPNPLQGWLKELEIEIRERYKTYPTWKVFRDAERQVFVFVSLYTSATVGLIEEFCATLPFDAFAAAWAKSGQAVNPVVVRRLVEHHNRLAVWAAVIDIVETEYLHDPVLPAEWRGLLDLKQLQWSVTDAGARGGELANQKVLEPEECIGEARARVELLLATARAHANITECYQVVFTLGKARLTLARCLDEWQQLAAVVPGARIDRRRLERGPRGAGRSQRGKQRKPVRPRKQALVRSNMSEAVE
jgi:hypothetical protein